MPMLQWPIILDASCLLNLCASGKLREIAATLPQPFVVAEYVVHQEVLYIRRRASEQEPERRESINIGSLGAAGLIQVLRLNSEPEATAFVDLASEMDDGEAMTCALALHRRYTVATDDRKARRVLSGHAPHVPIISTIAIVKQWTELAGVSRAELKATLLHIWSGANYYPGEREPLYAWWIESLA
jgi:predicted nucleic acid-binding protein